MNDRVTSEYLAPTRTVVDERTMTVSGTAIKTLVLLVVLVAAGAWGWASATQGIGGLCLLYFFVFVVSIFNWGWLYSDQFRTIGIAVSLIAIVLAALSLTLDFGAIEGGVENGGPKFMEWYLAYSLMVTLIWLYITLLRVLAWLSRGQ